ncbi:hypothetical protein GC176_16660 [bacterium]|nr:hypothetical protein [bacterium]
MNTVEFPQSSCRVGVARVEITPPVGIYHRMWGAATHDRATGIHRPLTATVLALAPSDSATPRPQTLFVAIDHCLLWHAEMSSLLDALEAASGLPREQIVVFFSHTHAAGLMGLERCELPGGELIPPYLDQLTTTLCKAVETATRSIEPATICYGTGRCSLAQNRDCFDDDAQRSVCGFNPEGAADDTVLVAKVVADASQQTIATLVNYACHPTTLAWDNTLISPDYVGAMRELVETATDAPCFFIQGASGDIGPRDGFVGDVAVADRNGRQLGHAVLSAIEGLAPPGSRLAYTGAVISGATIGTWQFQPVDSNRLAATTDWTDQRTKIPLRYRDDLPQRDELLTEREQWQQTEQDAAARGDNAAARDARAMVERMTRRLVRVQHLPEGNEYPYPLRLWKLGDAVWVALDGEHYNVLQRDLRAAFPDVPLIIGTLANGSDVWYLPDRDSFGKGLYQEDASSLAAGSLEAVRDALIDEIARLI